MLNSRKTLSTGWSMPLVANTRKPATRPTTKRKAAAATILRQTFNKAFKVKPPYVLALVELEEGPRLVSNLVGIETDPRRIRCDMPVEVLFHKLTEEITLPLFQPAGGAS